MSKYIYIANSVSESQVLATYCDTKDGGKISIGKPISYDVVEGEVSLSAAVAELGLIEAILAQFAKSKVTGRVGISCHRGLALKIAAVIRGNDIWQTWMETAQGDWAGYVQRIQELVNDAKSVGIKLYPVPARVLYTAECEAIDAEVIDSKTVKLGDVEFKDGQDVEFESVDDFSSCALGALYVNDAFVVGKRKLRIRVSKQGVAHITVRRFGYDKASDKLPDSVYGEAVSWFRFIAAPALSALEQRDGMAPAATAVA